MATTSTREGSANYDVFLSFRGSDTRKNFTDHLYKALVGNGIRTFRDEESVEKGGEIKLDLIRAIEGSRISVIVFSENYSSSKWCLGELLKIVECSRERGQLVLPVFYHVDPSQLRNQTGIYSEVFANYERNADQNNMEIIQKWKNALREVANLAGYELQTE